MIKTVALSAQDEFDNQVNALLKEGWKLFSTHVVRTSSYGVRYYATLMQDV